MKPLAETIHRSDWSRDRSDVLAAIEAELERAYASHGREPWGRHEWYAITLEELDEAWEAIKANRPYSELRAEIVQVAAMCIRYLETGDRYGWRS